MKTQKLLSLAIAAAAALALTSAAATPARAQSSLATHILMNLAGLSGQGPFYLDFQFLDGNGTGDGNSQAKVSNLTFSGGFLNGGAQYTGGASGDPTQAAGLYLGDADPGGVDEYTAQFFVSGGATAQLDYDLLVNSSAPLDTFAPDQFNFLILESDRSTPLPTTGPNGVEFMSVVVTGPTPEMPTYATAAESPVSLAAPQVVAPASAPEPDFFVFVGVAAALLLAAGGRGRDTARA